MTVSYLASKDLDRICRQFTTAPASVPGNSIKKHVKHNGYSLKRCSLDGRPHSFEKKVFYILRVILAL